MRQSRLVALLVGLACLGASWAVHADVPASRDRTPAPAERRTGRLAAEITAAPATTALPNHVQVTIPREHLRAIMAGATSEGPIEPPRDEIAGDASTRVRQIVAAAALTLAVLSLPLLAGRLRRGRVVAVALLVVLMGAAFVYADIAAPRRAQGERLPQTVEVIIVPGNGPVKVRLVYPPR